MVEQKKADVDLWPEPDWPALCDELREFGYDFTPEQVADPDWCIKELGRMGYSISVTFMTPDEYLDMVSQIGAVNVNSTFVRDNLNTISQLGGVYSYQLKGGRYATRGAHSSPLVPRLDVCASAALYNICRLTHAGET